MAVIPRSDLPGAKVDMSSSVRPMLLILEYAFGQLLFRMTLYGQSSDYPSCSVALVQLLRGSCGVGAAVTLSLLSHRMLLFMMLDAEARDSNDVRTTASRCGLFSL